MVLLISLLSRANLISKLIGLSSCAASLLTCLKDDQRKGQRLSLSPSVCLAIVTDSLGRILLIDTQALVCCKIVEIYLPGV